MSALRRTKAGRYGIESAHTLSEIEKAAEEGCLSDIVLSPDSAFEGHKKAMVTEEGFRFLKNGNALSLSEVEMKEAASSGEDVLIYTPEGGFAAVYTLCDDGFKIKRMFL